MSIVRAMESKYLQLNQMLDVGCGWWIDKPLWSDWSGYKAPNHPWEDTTTSLSNHPNPSEYNEWTTEIDRYYPGDSDMLARVVPFSFVFSRWQINFDSRCWWPTITELLLYGSKITYIHSGVRSTVKGSTVSVLQGPSPKLRSSQTLNLNIQVPKHD